MPYKKRKGSTEFAGYLQQDGTLADHKGNQIGTWRLVRTVGDFRPPSELDYLTDKWEAVEFKTARGVYAVGLSMGIGMLTRLQYCDSDTAAQRRQEALSYSEYLIQKDLEDAGAQENAQEEE